MPREVAPGVIFAVSGPLPLGRGEPRTAVGTPRAVGGDR